ncbi:MAG: hypothetical protein IPM99_11560 [Rubrivivax sp.]|nr:hypothetical protein [Rubrivivax sp.]
MSTVASRVVRSSPHRDTASTWDLIVDLLTQGEQGAARAELMSVAGVASSIIAERAPQAAAIVATCDGPRTRIYCLYDDDAIDGADAKEDSLGYEPLKGNWAVSLPCSADDLTWVQRALKAKSSRITARDQSTKLGESESVDARSQGLTLNVDAFLKS